MTWIRYSLAATTPEDMQILYLITDYDWMVNPVANSSGILQSGDDLYLNVLLLAETFSLADSSSARILFFLL